MTRPYFDRELQNLKDRLLALSDQVEQNILGSVDALMKRDHRRAQQVVANDEQVNQAQMELETDSLTLIATQQPLASDLRFIASVIAIATELERINDYAKGIGKISLLIGNQELLDPADDLPAMAEQATSMLQQALQAFLDGDVDAAYAIHEQDDDVDFLYNRVYEKVIARISEDPAAMDQATHLLWAAHNLERTADRVSNICERVIFNSTGRIVEMPETEAEIPYPQE